MPLQRGRRRDVVGFQIFKTFDRMTSDRPKLASDFSP